jgi:glycosyltransferase involved in cell wall biosynthesis
MASLATDFTHNIIPRGIGGASNDVSGSFRDEEFKYIIDKIKYRLKFTSTDTRDNKVALIHMLPTDMLHPLVRMGEVNIGLTVTETSSIPRWLAKQINCSLDALVLPTEWNKKVFGDSGVTIPIHVAGHTRSKLWAKQHCIVDTAHKDNTPYTFYFLGAWNFRKNPEAAIRAFMRAFPKPNKHNQRLIIKISNTMSIEPYIIGVMEDEKVGGSSRLGDDIHLITDRLSNEDIYRLHYNSHCFVSLHRGEGWGIGLFDAVLCGNQAVYTGYSAPEEFLRPMCQTLQEIGYTNQDVKVDGSALYFCNENQTVCQWGNPIIEQAVESMRSLVKSRACGPVGTKEHEEFINRYSWETIGSTLGSIITEYK